MVMRKIDVLNNLKGHALWPQSYHLSEAEAEVCIKALEQEPKTGHWINIGLEGKIVEQIVQSFTCSECGAISVFRITSGKIVNGDLCANCGAKMVEQERSDKE